MNARVWGVIIFTLWVMATTYLFTTLMSPVAGMLYLALLIGACIERTNQRFEDLS